MSVAHVSVDLLSAYLDRELRGREVEKVETHLEDCAECRRQLDALSRVVGRLRALERVAPPQVLEMDVQRQIALAEPRRSFFDQLERRGRLPIQPGILIGFALVFAFSAMLFTFVDGIDRIDRSGGETIPVVLSAPAAPTPSVDFVWVWAEGEWQRESVSSGVDRELARGSAEWEALRSEWAPLEDLEDRLEATDGIRLEDGTVVRLRPVEAQDP